MMQPRFPTTPSAWPTFRPALKAAQGKIPPVQTRAPAQAQPRFGSQTPPAASTYATAQQAVQWYQNHVAPIQPLERESRTQHGQHLAITGQLLGLMAPQANAENAFQQYKKIFNAVENAGVANFKASPKKQATDTSEAPQKHATRMYMHEKGVFRPIQGYGVLPYGFHVLVFAPNGAVESFRRNTPTSVNLDGKTKTNFKRRVDLFLEVSNDVNRAKDVLRKRKTPSMSIPPSLANAKRYTRKIFLPGQDGKDAWNQPVTPDFNPFTKAFLNQTAPSPEGA